MLCMDPKQRVSVQKCLESKWLTGLYAATMESHVKKMREIRQTKGQRMLMSEQQQRHYDEQQLDRCPELFDLSGEFESKINTLFGVRHLMYEELINFHRNRQRKYKRIVSK